MRQPDRRWLELSARCPGAGEQAAVLPDALVALGGRAVEERDGWYVTYFEEPEDLDAFRAAAADGLVAATGLGAIELRLAWQAHEDWAETWKRGLTVRRLTERIVVRPTWLEHTDRRGGDLEIVLDPGMAFGTAEHGTTRGCLRLLDRALRPGDRVIDVGSGSGILAVAAARLGAAEVIAIEGDPLAWEALANNVARNGVSERVRVVTAWADAEALEAYHPVDGVVANLEAATLRRLMTGLLGAPRTGGWLIVSGILVREWPALRELLERAGCRVDATDSDGDWRSALLTRLA